MKHRRIGNLCIKFILFFVFSNIYSQGVDLGFGVEASPFGVGEKRKVEFFKDKFIEKIAERFQLKKEKLENLRRKGFGRFELIRLILISQKANKSIDEIIDLRKKEKILNIAQKFNINYKELYLEAKKIKEELLKE